MRDFFCEQYPREYRLKKFSVNRGIAYGRNYVLNNVETEYLMFIDSDDIPLPKLVEKTFTKIVADPDLMAVGCFHNYIDKNDRLIGGGLFLGDISKELFFKRAQDSHLVFMQPTAVLRVADALAAGGFSTEGYFESGTRYEDYCEDLDLWTRMSDFYKLKKAIIVIPEVLSLYRKMENTASSNVLAMQLKMHFIKKNLILRRSGGKDLKFTDYYSNLTFMQIIGFKAAPCPPYS